MKKNTISAALGLLPDTDDKEDLPLTTIPAQ